MARDDREGAVNEGKALVGKLCRFWDADDPGPNDYAYDICDAFSTGYSGYMSRYGNCYANAEAIEVRPVSVDTAPEA